MDTYPETSFTLSDMPDTLKWLRKMRKMKLREVAESCGLSVSFLSDIERSRTPPSLGTLQKLARVYNTPLVLRLSALEAWATAFDNRLTVMESKG